VPIRQVGGAAYNCITYVVGVVGGRQAFRELQKLLHFSFGRFDLFAL
jgi:hypothetical protein